MLKSLITFIKLLFLPPGKQRLETQVDVNHIAQTQDLVLRNLQISQAYHDLNQGMARQLGVVNGCWLMFAIWASKTAGYSIRKEMLPWHNRFLNNIGLETIAVFERLVEEVTSINPAFSLEISNLFDLFNQILQSVSDTLSQGNLVVFQEIAPLFLDCHHLLHRSQSFDQAALDAFLAPLNPSEDKDGGQAYLRQAFTAYYQAYFETDSKRKAEWMWLGNLCAVYHEQIRLDPLLKQALNTPIEDLVHAWLRRKGLPTAEEDPSTRALVDWIQEAWHRFSTDYLMTMTVPDRILHLAQDVIPPDGRTTFPPDLETITQPDVAAMAAQLEHNMDSVLSSAATDWANLDSRMNFIAVFFRAWQQDHHLFGQPFTRYQRSLIRLGRVPGGNL